MRLLSFLLIGSFLLADVPPVPSLKQANKQQQVLKGCKVPAEIVILPPMMEDDYRECANRFYEPTVADSEFAISKMLGVEAKVESIKVAPNFLRAYEIAVKTPKSKLTMLCDEKLTNCYEIKKLHKKK